VVDEVRGHLTCGVLAHGAGWYRDKVRQLGITDGRTGSITAVQRFGSDLAR